jgi:membrane protein DedA with SNARE-associated domain
MGDLVQPTLALIAAHPGWAAAVMFAIAFIESSAFVSLVFPGTSLMIAAGALISAGWLPAPAVVAGAILGAVLGYAISWWAGRHFGGAVAQLWPLTRNPRLLPRGIEFFGKHGGKSVFIGRFNGPLRASIPLAAGVLGMPAGRFWVADIASALLWAPLLLLAGGAVGELGRRLIDAADALALVFGGLAVFGLCGIAWAFARARRSETRLAAGNPDPR